MPDNDQQPATQTLSVSQLNRLARGALEDSLGKVWVEGEISNLARPASGHLYFTLKDASAQVRCAFFRQRQRMNTGRLTNGDQVLAFGQVSIYEPRGDYQLIVEQVEAAGEGELRRRFEELKKRLAEEGLFAQDLKRPLPALPKRIGVITSPSGAAIRDILSVLQRRFPAIPVIIYPVAVQGDAAAPEIAQALQTASVRAECDVLILARGGGSLEDLWAFNEEIVARAIRDSEIPVISGIGHEIDFTIADFAADLRAPTPSGAAELVTPDQSEWLRLITAVAARLAGLSQRMLGDRAQALDWLSRRLGQASPSRTVSRQAERLRDIQGRLALAMRHDAMRRRETLGELRSRLLQSSPVFGLQASMTRLAEARHRLTNAARRRQERLQQRLKIAGRALHAVSPLATLDRGYAIVSDAETGNILHGSDETAPGQRIRARLARGQIEATVDRLVPADDKTGRGK